MALTEQEQKDLDVLRDHNFGFKFIFGLLLYPSRVYVYSYWFYIYFT